MNMKKLTSIKIALVGCLLACSVSVTQALVVNYDNWNLVSGENIFATGNNMLTGLNTLGSRGSQARLGVYGYGNPLLLYDFVTTYKLASTTTLLATHVGATGAGLVLADHPDQPCYYITGVMLSCDVTDRGIQPETGGDDDLPGTGGEGDGLLPAAAVPLPAAVWLLGSALIGLFGAGRRKA